MHQSDRLMSDQRGVVGPEVDGRDHLLLRRGARANARGWDVVVVGAAGHFLTPSWVPLVHEADAESLVFSFSDRPVQKALGIWRELKEA